MNKKAKVTHLPTAPHQQQLAHAHMLQLLASVDDLEVTEINAEEQEMIVLCALRILETKLKREEFSINSPDNAKRYARLKLAHLEHEEFMVIYLDSQHRVITSESLFRGTLSQASVYPREVVKQALKHNAAAVLFAHNHPSGVHEQSSADERLTSSLTQSLGLVDVRVLDHIVVSTTGSTSFAEKGLI